MKKRLKQISYLLSIVLFFYLLFVVHYNTESVAFKVILKIYFLVYIGLMIFISARFFFEKGYLKTAWMSVILLPIALAFSFNYFEKEQEMLNTTQTFETYGTVFPGFETTTLPKFHHLTYQMKMASIREERDLALILGLLPTGAYLIYHHKIYKKLEKEDLERRGVIY